MVKTLIPMQFSLAKFGVIRHLGILVGYRSQETLLKFQLDIDLSLLSISHQNNYFYRDGAETSIRINTVKNLT